MEQKPCTEEFVLLDDEGMSDFYQAMTEYVEQETELVPQSH